MVNPSDSSSNHHSPTTSTVTVAVTDSPTRKTLPAPWAQVVRGTDSEPLSAVQPSPSPPPPPPTSSSFTSSYSTLGIPASDQPPYSSSDPLPFETSNTDGGAATMAAVDSSDADKARNNNNNNNNDDTCPTKKPAWNKPTNGGAINVMGAASWPALSESTKTSPRSTSQPSSLPISDGSLSTFQEPIASHSPQKQTAGNAKPNPTPNYGGSNNRQKQTKRSNSVGAGGHAQSSFSAPPPPPFPVLQIPPSAFPTGVPGVVQDLSPGDSYKNSWSPRAPVGRFVPPTMEHRSRGNFGSHPRNDSYHNNYGNRRDQDRGNYLHPRDPRLLPPRMFPSRVMRPQPPNAPAFMGPQPMRPFPNPAGFPEYCYFPTLQLEPFGGMPFFTHGPPSAMFFPVAQTSLISAIVKQIDYYFSDANLVKDEFLRSNMDEHGWVPINLIANFPRVKDLTNNVDLILDSMRTSSIVEVEGDKLRRRNEWMKWLHPAPRRAEYDSTGGSSSNDFAADFGKINLDEVTYDKVNSALDPATNGVCDSIVD